MSVLITGAAGGIGSAIGRRLAISGRPIALGDVEDARAGALAAQIVADGGRAVAVAFLLSEQARYITGQALNVDGGIEMD